MMLMMMRRRRRTRKKTKKICWVVAGRMIGIGNHGSLRVVGWLEEEVWCLDSLLALIRVKFLSLVWKRLESLAMSSLVLGGAVGAVGDSKSPILSSPSSVTTSLTCLGFTRQMTLSGQLHILRIGSNMRDPGQSWSLGCPLAHLKYFLQLSGFGNSSPSLVQEALWAGLEASSRMMLRSRSLAIIVVGPSAAAAIPLFLGCS